MVAVAHPSPSSRTGARRAPMVPLDRRIERVPPLDGRRHLRLVVDNEAGVGRVDDRMALLPFPPATALGLAVAALVIFGGLFAIRAGQGSPGVDPSSASASGIEVAPPSVGDMVIVAKPGDTLWSVARHVAPNSDPRPVVDVLVSVNGGGTIRAGQQIIVPEQLLD